MMKYLVLSMFSKRGCLLASLFSWLFLSAYAPSKIKSSSAFLLFSWFCCYCWIFKFWICCWSTLLAICLSSCSFSFLSILLVTLMNSFSKRFCKGKLGRILMFILWQKGHCMFLSTFCRQSKQQVVPQQVTSTGSMMMCLLWSSSLGKGHMNSTPSRERSSLTVWNLRVLDSFWASFYSFGCIWSFSLFYCPSSSCSYCCWLEIPFLFAWAILDSLASRNCFGL